MAEPEHEAPRFPHNSGFRTEPLHAKPGEVSRGHVDTFECAEADYGKTVEDCNLRFPAQVSLVPVHGSEELRAARLLWNALLAIRNPVAEHLPPNCLGDRGVLSYIDGVMWEANRNGLFDKPGVVLKGPIQGDPDAEA